MSRRRGMIPPSAALVTASMRRYPRRPFLEQGLIPAHHLGAIVSCWSLCESGLIDIGASFSPLELEQALLNRDPQKQSALIVAIHTGLARLVSKSSIAMADTSTWRTSVVRAACSAGGLRLRTKVRGALADHFAAGSDNDDPKAEVLAMLGTIAMHPMFSDESKIALMKCADHDDVLAAALEVLKPYGKDTIDALEILFSFVRARKQPGGREPDDHDDPDEPRQGELAEEPATTENGEKPASRTDSTNQLDVTMAEGDAVEGGLPTTTSGAPQEETNVESSLEEEDRLAKILIMLELKEYALLDLDSKLFFLNWLCERAADSKYVHDTIEAAVNLMEAQEQELAAMEENHVAEIEADRLQEGAEIVTALRERARLAYLRSIISKDWSAKYSKRPSRSPVDDVDGMEIEPERDRRRFNPEDALGKVIDRSVYGIVRQITVKSLRRNKQGEVEFHCVYEDDKPYYEELALEDVRKSTSTFMKCTDEEFIAKECSEKDLRSLTEEQLELLENYFLSKKQTMERQLALKRLVPGGRKKDQPRAKIQPGMAVATTYGQGFLLAHRDSKLCDIRLDWGAMAYLRTSEVAALESWPVMTRTDFEARHQERLKKIEEQKEKLRKMQLSYRLDPVARDAFDDALVFNTGNGACMVLAPPTDDFPYGVIERCSASELKTYFAGEYNPTSPTHPNWEGNSRELDFKLKENQAVADLILPDGAASSSGPFNPPIWIAPEIFHDRPRDDDAFQPFFHAKFILNRLESEFQPWLAPRTAAMQEVNTYQDLIGLLLDLDDRLMLGLGHRIVIKSFQDADQEATSKPPFPFTEETPKLPIEYPEDMQWSKRRRPQVPAKSTFADVVSTLTTETSLEETWKNEATKLQICRAAGQDEDQHLGSLCGTLLDRKRKQVVSIYDRASDLRTRLLDFIEHKRSELWGIRYSLDPAFAACSDAALMFLLRWVPRRRSWRSKLTNVQSFSGVVTEAIKLERATFELRRAGATVGVPRENIIRPNATVMYNAAVHQKFLQEDKPRLPWYVPPDPGYTLLDPDDTDTKRVKVIRVDLHTEFSYVVLEIEEGEEEEPAEDVAQQELKRRQRTNVDCIIVGCTRKAVSGNYGHCEVHRQLRRRGRPPLRAKAGAAGALGKGSATEEVVSEAEVSRPEQVRDEDVCYVCFEGGELLCCDYPRCPKVYHLGCLGRQFLPSDENQDGSEAVWHCPMHRFPEKSREKHLQLVLLGILDGIAAIEHAELVAGSANDMRYALYLDDQDQAAGGTRGTYQASDLIAMRRKCIIDAAYDSFDAFNEDADALKERFCDVADETGNPLLREVAIRVWKFIKVKVGKARVAFESMYKHDTKGRTTNRPSTATAATNSLPPPSTPVAPIQPHRPDMPVVLTTPAQPVLGTGLASTPMFADLMSASVPDPLEALSRPVLPVESVTAQLLQGGEQQQRQQPAGQVMEVEQPATAKEKTITYFEGEELDKKKFSAKVDPGSHQPVSPGRVLLNIATAIEIAKSSIWPQPWDKCERISKGAGALRAGKRKVDEFSMVENFEPLPGEQFVMIYRIGVPYLFSERHFEKAQAVENALDMRNSLIKANEEVIAAAKEYEDLKTIAERAWFLFAKRSLASLGKTSPVSTEEEAEFAALSEKFMALETSTKPKVATLTTDATKLGSTGGSSFAKKVRSPSGSMSQMSSMAGTPAGKAVPNRLLAEYVNFAASGHSAYQRRYEEENPECPSEVVRVLDDMVSTVEHIEEGEMGLRKDVFVTPVMDGCRIVKHSGQRLVASIQRAASEKAPHYGAHRVGAQVFVKLNDDDEAGWPAEVMDCRVTRAGRKDEFVFDVQYEHDGFVEHGVTQDRLISRPNMERYVFKVQDQAAIAIRNVLRFGKILHVDTDQQKCKVLFKDAPRETDMVRFAQIRPLSWVKKAAQIEAQAVQVQESKRQRPLRALELPKKRVERPIKDWIDVRFVTNTYVVGKATCKAIVQSKELAPYEEFTVSPGDVVEVLVDHLRKKDSWKSGAVVRILPAELGLVVVRLDEANHRQVIVDKRLLRSPQPVRKELPFEDEVESAEEDEEEEEEESEEPDDEEDEPPEEDEESEEEDDSEDSWDDDSDDGRRKRKKLAEKAKQKASARTSYNAAPSSATNTRQETPYVPYARQFYYPTGTRVFVTMPPESGGQRLPAVIAKKPVGKLTHNPRNAQPLYTVYYEFNNTFEHDVEEARLTIMPQQQQQAYARQQQQQPSAQQQQMMYQHPAYIRQLQQHQQQHASQGAYYTQQQIPPGMMPQMGYHHGPPISPHGASHPYMYMSQQQQQSQQQPPQSQSHQQQRPPMAYPHFQNQAQAQAYQQYIQQHGYPPQAYGQQQVPPGYGAPPGAYRPPQQQRPMYPGYPSQGGGSSVNPAGYGATQPQQQQPQQQPSLLPPLTFPPLSMSTDDTDFGNFLGPDFLEDDGAGQS